MPRMNCPKCGTNLLRESKSGDAMLKNSGLILKANSLVAVCPHCKADVPFSQTMTQAVHDRAILFFKGKS